MHPFGHVDVVFAIEAGVVWVDELSLLPLVFFGANGETVRLLVGKNPLAMLRTDSSPTSRTDTVAFAMCNRCGGLKRQDFT